MITKSYIKNLLIRTIISLLLFFFLSLLLKQDKTYIETYNILFKNNIDFSYIKSKTNYLLGTYITNKETYVSSEKFIYKEVYKINNSYEFMVDNKYLINNLCNGIVINKTKESVSVSCDDLTTIKYDNLENININLYDYINKGKILGNTKEDKLTLTLKHKDKFISYENYI